MSIESLPDCITKQENGVVHAQVCELELLLCTLPEHNVGYDVLQESDILPHMLVHQSEQALDHLNRVVLVPFYIGGLDTALRCTDASKKRLYILRGGSWTVQSKDMNWFDVPSNQVAHPLVEDVSAICPGNMSACELALNIQSGSSEETVLSAYRDLTELGRGGTQRAKRQRVHNHVKHKLHDAGIDVSTAAMSSTSILMSLAFSSR